MRVIVVGSGMTGLTAAAELAGRGHDVVVLDKGRSPGGRMATRDVGQRRFDHGAQHFSARSDPFRARVAEWLEAGHVEVWYEAQSVTQPELGVESRYVATGGMRSLMGRLADSLDVRQSTAVEAIAVADGDVEVIAGGTVIERGDAIVVTPPLPQALALLERGGIVLPEAQAAIVDRVIYDPSLTVMATLDGPSELPDGHLSLDGAVAWIADNHHKGVSPRPTVTIQSSAEYATGHFDADPAEWAEELAAIAQPHLRAAIVDVIPHRWRYAQPRRTLDIGALRVDGPAPIVLAGEAFAGAKVEGAFLSGLAAARLVDQPVLA